ncbi:visual pigment-like receptor peropsin [Hetaerina americana]|uniref:visual pigment-like receptor peropsin n=1 Tax=Hetaerina americana TaxID=62018 RepID=UPI003A7F4E83
MGTPSLTAVTPLECSWNTLEVNHLAWLGAGLIIFGIIGSAANGLLCAGCLLGVGVPGNRVDQCHRLLLLNLSIASLGTLLLAGFPFTGPSSIYGRWIFGNACCQLFAFLRQMFGLSQMLALMLLAIERYWLFYFITKEISRMLTLKGIAWSVASCWTLAIAWAIPPLVHWGRYSCDSTRSACELDWHLLGSGQVTYNVSYLLLGIVTPSFIICFCLWRAYKVIRLLSMDTNDFITDSLGQYFITKVVAFSVIGMFLCWLPRAIIVFWTMLLRSEENENIPTSLKILSPIFVEASTIVPFIVYASIGSHVRQIILGIFKRSTLKSRHGMISLQMK